MSAKLIDPTNRPGGGPIGIDQQLGFRYLTFVVTNLDAVCQHLEANNVEFTRQEPGDNVQEFPEGFCVFVDPKSLLYLKGLTLGTTARWDNPFPEARLSDEEIAIA